MKGGPVNPAEHDHRIFVPLLPSERGIPYSGVIFPDKRHILPACESRQLFPEGFPVCLPQYFFYKIKYKGRMHPVAVFCCNPVPEVTDECVACHRLILSYF